MFGRARSSAEEPTARARTRERQAIAVRQSRRLGELLESIGGLWTIALVLGAVLIVGALTVANRASTSAVSREPLKGELFPSISREHVADPNLVEVTPGQPPVGGPHFATPQAPDSYDVPIPDGNAIHSLEHGIVWISYNPAKVSVKDVKALQALWAKFRADVIVSPRPDNEMPVAAASWEHLLRLQRADRDDWKISSSRTVTDRPSRVSETRGP